MKNHRIKIIYSAGKQDCNDVIKWLEKKGKARDVELIDHEESPSVGETLKVYKTPTLVRENGEFVIGQARILAYLKGFFINSPASQ